MSLKEQDLEKHTVGIQVAPVDEVEPIHVSPEQDKIIRRKIDLHIMPVFCAIYGLQFLDKVCLSYASVMGIRKDAHLTLSQYSWLGSIFYLGYLVGEFPLNYALQRLPMAKFTTILIIVWGGTLMTMAAGRNFTHLMVIRFFLGFFESAITPALSLFTAQYYKSSEQGFRTGIWFSFNSWGAVLGSILAFALYSGDVAGTLPIQGWKLVFLILGALTIAAGVAFFFLVPDKPSTARFFDDEQKILAVERVRQNQHNLVVHVFRRHQALEAILDPFTWMYAAISMISCIVNGGYTNFSSILIAGFGFSTKETLLLGMAGASMALMVVFFAWLGDKLKRRCLVALMPTLLACVGPTLVWALPTSKRGARLFGFYFTPFICVYITALSLVTTNVAGRTKKTVVSAIYLIFYCVGNLIGPQTYRAQDAPRYMPALATSVACSAVNCILIVALHFMYVRENAKRDAKISENEVAAMQGHEFDDLTDRENPVFRYTL